MELVVAQIAILIISVALAISRLRKYLFVKLRQYNMSKNFGGPRAYPIIGNSFMFLGDLNVITKRLINMSQKYTLPGRLWLGSSLYVFLEDPEQLKIITESPHGLEKSGPYDYMKPCLGNGLLTAPGKYSSAFLDSIFESFYHDGKYTEKEIQDEINTIIFTGSDTIAIAITFTLLMLATYPEIQEKAYDELLEIYGTSDPEDIPITNQDIKKMKYMERVIKETLRLFPTVPLIGRYLTEDIEVSKNTVIPKNCQVIFFIYTLHRNKKYWKDPLEFNPDRFLPGNYDSKYFRPFGFLKRNCIGQGFAIQEIKTIIATVLRKFIIRIDDPINIQDIPLIFGITLNSAKSILLRFIRR
ncbi:hypothetical protein M0802_016553 [Mischocyttarus mexicanus]|nr:hypothetical protein M0802_016553 [Mischocyttarus mexicanus]